MEVSKSTWVKVLVIKSPARLALASPKLESSSFPKHESQTGYLLIILPVASQSPIIVLSLFLPKYTALCPQSGFLPLKFSILPLSPVFEWAKLLKHGKVSEAHDMYVLLRPNILPNLEGDFDFLMVYGFCSCIQP